MTVDEPSPAVEEADRLGEQLVPGYRPSEIFGDEALIKGKDHLDRGHVAERGPNQCPEARFYKVVTTNQSLAQLLFDEQQRGAVGRLLDEKVDALGFEYPGVVLHSVSGMLELEKEQLLGFEDAFSFWSDMRCPEVVDGLPATASGTQIAKAVMWEGFLAGVMFAQAAQEDTDGSE